MTGTRNIILTGASRGIGAVATIELARAGFTVGALSRKGTGPESETVPAELAERIIPLRGDVDDIASVRAAMDQFVAKTGRIDGLVNNAGIHEEGPSAEMPPEVFARVMATNATSVFAVSQVAYPHLIAAGSGLIVNIGSFFDKLGVRHNTAYCASKAAVGAITRCLAVEWGREGIRVLSVAPGYIETDLNRDFLRSEKVQKYLSQRIPTGGPVGAIEVGEVLTMLFSNTSTFLTGETIYLDGAMGVAV